MMSEADHKPKSPVPPFEASDQGGDDPANLKRIEQRNRLIVQLMEIDAKQRHLDSMQIGLALEVHRLESKPDAHLAGLQRQLRDVEAQLRRLRAQRDWLAAGLAEIDGAAAANPGSDVGRA